MKRKFNFDYSKTVMMKLDIGVPDNNGGCQLFNTFEQALERIKIMDCLTCGAPKIVYLVGWQYNGHDDKYPAFFEVNKYAKRQCDATARDSLVWLMKEAKKYNTTVSLHINLSDAYPDSPLWEEYIDNNLILLKNNGKPKVTGTWNGRAAYQVRFAQEYKSGYFQKRVDALLELLPVADAGTIHIDAFFVRKGKDTTIAEEKKYRRKMIEYFMSRGVDVTSEFIYREWQNGYRCLWGKSDIVGLIPAIWNLRMTQKDYLQYPPSLLAGGKLNMNIQLDKNLQYLFYGNTSGEEYLSMDGDWEKAFLESFALGAVCYFYLNDYEVQRISGKFGSRVAHFSSGVETSIKERSIRKNGDVLKVGETLCLPIGWADNEYFAYSKTQCTKTFPICGRSAEIYKITPDGQLLMQTNNINNNKLAIDFNENEAFLVKVI